MKKIIKYISLVLTIWMVSFSQYAASQIVCANVDITPNAGSQTDFVFDSFNKYIAGITYHGVANIDIKVDDQTPANPNCKWMLSMIVENNPSGGTNADEWETITQYGMGGIDVPKIDILEVRVTNNCSTSPVDGVYQTFTLAGDQIEIIENTGVRINAGSCTTNVNGPGSYLTNYDEFHFQIDFRVTPGFNYNAGIYQLQVKFELVEVP